MLRLIVAVVGLVALLASVILVYYAISFIVLRGVGLMLPLAGRRKRKKGN